ncbi:20 kDa chaperonin, chloroplastic-like, partial [Brassica napus]
MATKQLIVSPVTVSAKSLASLRVSSAKFGTLKPGTLKQSQFCSLVVKAASVVAPKYTSIKPLGDRILVKIKEAEEKTMGGI